MSFVVEMSPFPLTEQVRLMLMFANSAYKILVQLEIVPFPTKSKASLDRKGKNGFTAVFNASLSHRSDTYFLTNIQSQQLSPIITQILFSPTHETHIWYQTTALNSPVLWHFYPLLFCYQMHVSD